MPKVRKCVAKSTLKFVALQGSRLRSQNLDPIKGIKNLNTNELLWDTTVSSGGSCYPRASKEVIKLLL